jgi:chemotaxis-related protein WspB
MLLLLFQAADQTYGLDASCILEVSPVPELRQAPHAPPYVAGLLNYRGRTIPAIDLTYRIAGRASRPALSTRLLLARYDSGEERSVLGLIAERAVETVTCHESDFDTTGIDIPDTPYLGKAAILNGKIVQLVTVGDALGAEARALLSYYAS